MMEDKNSNWRETLNREWMHDFPSLTTEQVNKLLQNIFYQIFLIELDEIDYRVITNENGMRVRFDIEGTAYKDGSTILEDEDIDEEE
jgi:hypothetical protein